jgi:hypothetical protein
MTATMTAPRTVTVAAKAWAKAVALAHTLIPADDSETPVDVVADAVLQFRTEVGRDPVDMDELQAFSDGEEVSTTTPAILTVAALKELLLTRGLKGTSGLTKAALLEYLETGAKPAKSAPTPGTVADLWAQCKSRGLKGVLHARP